MAHKKNLWSIVSKQLVGVTAYPLLCTASRGFASMEGKVIDYNMLSRKTCIQ